MKLKTVLVIAGLVATAGGVSAIAAVGDGEGGRGMRWGKGGHHGGHHGDMMGHGRQGGGFGRLQQLDTDKNGDVTLAEFLKPREARFAELDTNKDGIVDAAELAAQFKAKAGDRIDGMLKRLDANGDGRISREEFALASVGGKGYGRGHGGWGHHGRHHRMGGMDGPGRMGGEGWGRGDDDMDRAGDRAGPGKAGEAPAPSKSAEAQPDQAGEAQDGERRGWRGRHRWGGEERRGEGRARFVAAVEGRFKVLDKNGDGFIDKAELEAAQAEEIDYRVKKMLHTLDRNKDGKITAEESLAPAKERFARLDLNDDGKISSEDMPPSRRAAWTKR
jgi:Ca2+-binding EF-hand superfamily protein